MREKQYFSIAWCIGVGLAMAIALDLIFPAVAWAQPSSSQLNDWTQANVIYLGEHHDAVQDHQAEQEIISALYERSPQMTLGFEMFQRPFQSVLTQFVHGEIDETSLKVQSEFDNRWGFDWDYYSPILRFARDHHLSVRALNTPLEVTQKVGQTGLSSLSSQDFQWIPGLSEIDLDNAAYRDRIKAAYEQFHQGQGNSTSFENFYQAQILWDETMADAIASYVNAHPDQLFITLVGAGHVASEDGLPNRVKQRIQFSDFRQYAVPLNTENE